MKDFSTMRRTMVACQLEPSGISAPEILTVFENTPRESFLPPAEQAKAYVDEDLSFMGGGVSLPEPIITARMIQAVKPHIGDVVLNMGDRTGYVSALVAPLVSTVMTIETEEGQAQGFLDQARQVWQEMSLCNIALLRGKKGKGIPEHGPYSVILINGAVAEVPEDILAQLMPGGRLATVVKPDADSVGHLTLIEKKDDGLLVRTSLQEAETPYLDSFLPQERFVF